jgi:hypothetical protein
MICPLKQVKTRLVHVLRNHDPVLLALLHYPALLFVANRLSAGVVAGLFF